MEVRIKNSMARSPWIFNETNYICSFVTYSGVSILSSISLLTFLILVAELEIKVQKDNFEKQSNAIKSDAELKLAEVQTLLETERDRFRIEVRFFDSLRVKRKKWVT